MQHWTLSEFPSSMLVGIAEIDEEHEAIFWQIKRDIEASQNWASVTLQTAFKALVRSFEEHFRHEEKLMADAKYATADVHAAYHRQFLGHLEALAAQFDGKASSSVRANFDALDALFRDAFQGDAEFADWLKRR